MQVYFSELTAIQLYTHPGRFGTERFGSVPPGRFGTKQKTITNRRMDIFKKQPVSGNLFWDWWTLVGTGWYQRHTRNVQNRMILKKKKIRNVQSCKHVYKCRIVQEPNRLAPVICAPIFPSSPLLEIIDAPVLYVILLL